MTILGYAIAMGLGALLALTAVTGAALVVVLRRWR